MASMKENIYKVPVLHVYIHHHTYEKCKLFAIHPVNWLFPVVCVIESSNVGNILPFSRFTHCIRIIIQDNIYTRTVYLQFPTLLVEELVLKLVVYI